MCPPNEHESSGSTEPYKGGEFGGGCAPEPSVMGARHLGETPSGITPVRRPAPETIGAYRVRGVLGEGGFGVVYLAEQEKPVRRQVAIKLLRAGRENDQVIARFHRERQSLVRMEHPGIARVFETAELPDGRPYIVMELVRGLPVTTFCDEGKLTLRARLELVGQVCRAVQHAHTKGMIHRDLKPSNVLVTVSDGEPVVKIIDFGIAKPVSQHDGDQTVYTQLHQIVGTPGYMSPEQVRGLLDIDTRTDVYSIGVMLYELLAGVMPLDPALFKYKTAAETERIISESEPARPSMRVSRSVELRDRLAMVRGTDAMGLARELKGELDWVVMRCLEKDPARRYQSPAALEADLRRYLSGEAVEAVPPTLGYRAKKYVRRHRALVVSGAAIVFALVGGLATAGYGLYQATLANVELTRTNTKLSEAIEEVTRQEKKATREAARSGAFSKFFVDEVLGSARPANVDGEGLTIGEVLDESVLKLDAIEDGSVRADVEAKIGEIYRMLARHEDARTHLQNAVMRYRSDPEVPRILLSGAMLELSRVLHLLFETGASVEYAREAYEIRLAELGERAAGTLYAAQHYAIVLERTERREDALGLIERTYRHAIEAADAGPECREQLLVMSTYAQMVLMSGGRGQERFEVMTRVLETADRLRLPDYDMARYLGMYGEAAAQIRRYDEAASSLHRAIEIERRLQGRDTASVAGLMSSLANALRLSKRLDEAEAMARQSIEIYERIYGSESEWVASVTVILAATLRGQQRFEDADAAFASAVKVYKSVLPEGSWRTLNVQSLHGELMIDLKRFDDAERMLVEVERGLRADRNARASHELTMRRLVKLYEATGNAAEWERWSAELVRGSSAAAQRKE